MRQIRLDSKEGVAAGWAGVSDARNLPDRARGKNSAAKTTDDGDEQSKRGGFLSGAFRFARNAVVGLLLISSVPFGAVLWRTNHLTTRPWADTRDRIADAEKLRPLSAPVDASIAPMDAGIAFAALQAPQMGIPVPADYATSWSEAFVPRSTAPQPMWPWRAHKAKKEMFVVRTGGFDGPSSQEVILNADRGFTPDEMAWLKELAEAPVWNNFDKVASAGAVDIIGGQFQLPFPENASAIKMPIMKFAYTKELAYAGVARAAYYVAMHEPERAEAALRSVVGFGFALIDNGSSAIDGLIGRVIVGIGRNGWEQFASNGRTYPFGYDPSAPETKLKNSNWGDPRGIRISAEDLRRRLLNDVSDATLPRTLRFEQLSQLSVSSCSSIPGMVFGPDQEMRDAFATAATTLARFPSEKAQLELILDETNRVPDVMPWLNPVSQLIVGSGVVAATVTGNERLAACTKIAIGYW